MGNGSDEMQFRELLGKLEALWTTEKFCEKQDDVWRLLKRDVPRRSRFTCDTVHDLLDILTDREVITPQETVLLKRLAAVFSVQEASEHIQAFRKIPLDQDTCSLCSAPCQAPLLYRTPVQEITGARTQSSFPVSSMPRVHYIATCQCMERKKTKEIDWRELICVAGAARLTG
ncbi:uncharacterized protein LOC119161075 isoform X3 [Rhipicephalus microplus]|uniref:uncharacterized protein LOC119161075 isoform X3 n=1 Tax=Rhipicephalus microplus TaxID=6941 RepID=UPI003F6C62BF